MTRIVGLVAIIVLLAIACSGCQSIDLKRGWDSVPVGQVSLEVCQRAPVYNAQGYLPHDDYWYKYQDNYKPPKN